MPSCQNQPSSYQWKATRNTAKKRGIPFEITKEYVAELFEKQDGKCAFTGWPLEIGYPHSSREQNTGSLDRIDSTKGYVPGNLQWVHRDVNQMKLDLPLEEFIRLCRLVAEHARSKAEQ